MLYLKNQYYHIYNRAVDGNRLFIDHEDYLLLLKLINKYKERYAVKMIAYCLIPNHYHFLIQQISDLPFSRFIQVVFNSYVQIINLKRERSGTLFMGSAKSRVIKNEEYLLQVCRYIHANPVKHSLVSRLEDWKYSNYAEFIGKRTGTLFDREFLFSSFVSKSEYQEWVEEYLTNFIDASSNEFIFD